MDALKDYVNTVWPQRWRVCGVLLQPFCIGHAFLLARWVPELLAKKPEPSLKTLLLAVFICSRPPMEAEQALGKRLPFGWWLTCWRIKMGTWIKPFLVEVKHAELNRYIKACLPKRDVWVDEESSDDGGVPSLLGLRLSLTELGYSFPEIMDLPFGQGVAEVQATNIMVGGAQPVSEADRAAMELARKMQEDASDEGAEDA